MLSAPAADLMVRSRRFGMVKGTATAAATSAVVSAVSSAGRMEGYFALIPVTVPMQISAHS